MTHLILQLKETKTVRGGAECPTLLHYLAKVLLRTDPSLLTFIEEMPHLEAAARGWFHSIWSLKDARLILCIVASVQTTVQAVNSLVTGLNQVNGETNELRKLRDSPSNDMFIQVMQVLPSICFVISNLNRRFAAICFASCSRR